MKPTVYWKTLLGSISSPTFYVKILNSKLWFSLRFFLISYLLIGLIGATLMINLKLPSLERQVHQTLADITYHYPADLEISWQDQILAVNRQYLQFSYPSTSWDLDQFPEFLGLIKPDLDENNSEQLATDLPRSSLVVVTDSHLLISQTDQQWSLFPLKDLPGFENNFVISQESLPWFINSWQQELSSIFHKLKYTILALYPIFLTISKLWISFFYTIICYFLLKLYNKSFPFSKVFQLCLHLAIPAELLTQATRYLYPQHHLSMFPLTFWILFLILSYNLKKVDKIKIIAQPPKK